MVTVVKVKSIGHILAGFMACFLSSPAWADEPPAVVASIKPIHAIVAGVMEGIGKPYLLVRGGGSPHGYAMKPTDARMLANARLVFWVGENMEAFLTRPIETIAGHADIVRLGRTPGLILLPFREGGAWEDHAREQEGKPHAEDEHNEHEPSRHHGMPEESMFDMHVWLDPRNAAMIADAAAASLARVDPERAGTYHANAIQLRNRLRDLDAELSESLGPVKDKPYIVFHDAYQYFDRRYDLTPVGSITVNPDRAPGAARLKEIRKKLRESGALCVFAEPQFAPRLAKTVIEGSQAKLAVLDPLGADIAEGPDLYFTLMKNLASGLTACLLPES